MSMLLHFYKKCGKEYFLTFSLSLRSGLDLVSALWRTLGEPYENKPLIRSNAAAGKSKYESNTVNDFVK